MHFSTPLTSLLLIALSASPILAQSSFDASALSASLASVQSKYSAEASEIETRTASLKSAASAAIYSLTHCNPSYASWYHSLTSVLATETNAASLSALESSINSNPHSFSGCDATAFLATASTLAVSASGAAVTTGAAAASSGSVTPAATATSSIASTGAGYALAPVMGMGGVFILGVAAWL